MPDKIRAYRTLVKEPTSLKDLDYMEADLVNAKRVYEDRPSDIASIRARAETIASQFETDATAPTAALAPSGSFGKLAVPWSDIQRQLRTAAAGYREIVADIDEWRQPPSD